VETPLHLLRKPLVYDAKKRTDNIFRIVTAHMKLASQVSLLLIAAVLFTALAMAGLFAFSLESGFRAYVNRGQLTHLANIERALNDEAKRMGSLDHLRDDERAWGSLLNRTEPRPEGGQRGDPPNANSPRPLEPRPWRGPEFDERRGPPEGRPDGAPPDRPPRPRPPRGPDDFDGPPRKGPPEGGAPRKGGDGLRLGPRFFLVDSYGRPFHERPPQPNDGSTPMDREIRHDGRVVGVLRHYPVIRAIRDEDIAFLRAQFQHIAWAALVLLGVAGLVAPFVARRWSRPIRDIGIATERIAKGEFSVRLKPNGDDEIGQLQGNLNTMAESLERLESARKRWIAESAHELRTPLAVLRGELEALQDGVRKFDSKAVGSLQDEARHLTKLVNDLHLLAMADMGSLPCTMTQVDAAALARRMAERFVPRASERGLVLNTAIPDQSMMLEADDDRLEQLLTNLLENSLRYTDAPGVVEVRMAQQAGVVTLTVEDTAPGVTQEQCSKLFEPLYRADSARSRKAGGSGLGLAICRAIVEAHGGKIVARPSPMGGIAVVASFSAAK
jgi:two-component system sensor histidine kinase BaeS